MSATGLLSKGCKPKGLKRVPAPKITKIKLTGRRVPQTRKEIEALVKKMNGHNPKKVSWSRN